jgi:hypothetical protein
MRNRRLSPQDFWHHIGNMHSKNLCLNVKFSKLGESFCVLQVRASVSLLGI